MLTALLEQEDTAAYSVLTYFQLAKNINPSLLFQIAEMKNFSGALLNDLAKRKSD